MVLNVKCSKLDKGEKRMHNQFTQCNASLNTPITEPSESPINQRFPKCDRTE